ncbi:MAG: HAD family hydrolase [Methanosarcinales archaeon]
MTETNLDKNIKAILLDLDGTLVDTSELIINSLKQTLSIFGKEVALEELRSKSKQSPSQILKYYLPNIKYNESKEKYWRFYKESFNSQIKAFSGVVDVVKELADRGYKLGIVTSLASYYAKKALEVTGLSENIEVVVAYQDTTKHKPDPEPIKEAIKRLQVNPIQTLYVGDSQSDIIAGKRAGVYTAAALWGVPDATEKNALLHQNPNYQFKSISDLKKLSV